MSVPSSANFSMLTLKGVVLFIILHRFHCKFFCSSYKKNPDDSKVGNVQNNKNEKKFEEFEIYLFLMKFTVKYN